MGEDLHGIKMDTFVGTWQCIHRIERASDMFKEMHSTAKFSWTTVMLEHVWNVHAEEAIDIFYKILRAFEAPDGVTFFGVLTGCVHAGLVDNG
jgi:hypothetical protein